MTTHDSSSPLSSMPTTVNNMNVDIGEMNSSMNKVLSDISPTKDTEDPINKIFSIVVKSANSKSQKDNSITNTAN